MLIVVKAEAVNKRNSRPKNRAKILAVMLDILSLLCGD
jgi:hypothetical protein